MDQTTPTTVWRQEFDLRHSELDSTGRLSSVGMTRLFQESAGAHAEALGVSLEDLRREGLTWVLGKFHIKLQAAASRPRWRATVHVETWRSGLERFFAARDYRATSADGSLIAEATSYWAVIDVAQRRAVPLPGSVRDSYQIDAPRVAIGEAGFGRLRGPVRPDLTTTQRVRRSDLDTNGHVTNTAYMLWALDSISDEHAKRGAEGTAELEIIFKSEALPGDVVECDTQVDATEREAVFLHRLFRKDDGREFALAKTTYRA